MKVYTKIGLILLCTFTICACKGDEYHYPSVELNYATATTSNNGSVQTILTDDGKLWAVQENQDKTTLKADSAYRVVGYFEPLNDKGIKIYSLAPTISPIPLPANNPIFKGGIKTDPATVQSSWMGKDYLNILLLFKRKTEIHRFHFIEESIGKDKKGHKQVNLLLYHDANKDVEAFSSRAYLSVPLRQYGKTGDSVMIRFSYYAEDGLRKDLTPYLYIR